MGNTSSENRPLKRRDIAYYRQRQKNRVFTALAAFFADEARQGNVTKKELAIRLGRDPAQITRWLSAPSNFELDTLSDILLAMGAEMDHEIVRFQDRCEVEDIYCTTGTDANSRAFASDNVVPLNARESVCVTSGSTIRYIHACG
jgi:hypothetical protein